MPATMYMSDDEKKLHSTIRDKDIREELEKVHNIINRKIYIEEHVYTSGFIKKRIYYRYTLYADCRDEVQILNFYTAGDGFGYQITKETVIGYLLGIHVGASSSKK